MAFDLGNALRRKQEFETARLDDFEFRLRSRRMRLLADWARHRSHETAALDPVWYASRIAELDDRALLLSLAERLAPAGVTPEEVLRRFEGFSAEARRQLIAERGDPTPHRLA